MLKNPFVFNLVQFDNQTYGLRRGLFDHQYIDLSLPNPTKYDFLRTIEYVKRYCQSTKEKAQQVLDTINSPFSRFV